jgi:ATP-binding cassette subfamily B protein
LIQDALENLFKGRTVIAVAHRLATIRSMDRICVVDREIIEQGTHEALVQISDGVYKKLWNLQSGDPDERPGGYLQ